MNHPPPTAPFVSRKGARIQVGLFDENLVKMIAGEGNKTICMFSLTEQQARELRALLEMVV